MAMEAVVGAANWVLGKVLTKLSDDLVAAYVASTQLGLNHEEIQRNLKFTKGLLEEAQRRAMDGHGGLQDLLQDLRKKADEAEDALDELHYFLIQDALDGTQEAALEVAGAIRGPAVHARHAVCDTISKWLPCFSCTRAQEDGGHDPAAAEVTPNTPHDAHEAKADHGDGKLRINRVDMSTRIKSVMEGMHKLCTLVSDLLKTNTSANLKTAMRPTATTTSGIKAPKLYGSTTRRDILDTILNDMTTGQYSSQTLSVLPIFGPGGIGKTTFTTYLYNHERVENAGFLKVWVCVSTSFNVVKLTQEILSCLPLYGEEDSRTAHQDITNLDRLQQIIEKRLMSKRFLIVMDDIWKCDSEEEWKTLLAPFTKGETKGNMVIVTTRFPKIAKKLKTTEPIPLRGLEPEEFFPFFKACIFSEDKSTPEYNHDLIQVAKDIADKLKGSPLAAKTVGRLLKKDYSLKHWKEVLENNEWQKERDADDIMPSLKISYDYLPLHIKFLFPYCALFPEDHEIHSSEITRFWNAIGIIDDSAVCDNKYLEELVDNGFLSKEGDNSEQYYAMHDLFHELARDVSSQECANICSSGFRADKISATIHHLSITIQDEYGINFEEQMGKLKEIIDIGNLRTLMIFNQVHSYVKSDILIDTFKEIKRLRVLFLPEVYPDCFLDNLSKLVHLRFLKIESNIDAQTPLAGTLSRIYHLKFLDLVRYAHNGVPKDINRLVNLCQLLGHQYGLSDVPWVGRIKFLENLQEFHVKKEETGFDMGELGKLTELRGKLTISNLEVVETKEEASRAGLLHKRNLEDLTLVWGIQQEVAQSDVLDGLQPHDNLASLEIINHGGAVGPSWLFGDIIHVKNLKALHLENVSWSTLPPFRQLQRLTHLKLKKVRGMRRFGPDSGSITQNSLVKLKVVEFVDMPELEEWVGGDDISLFSGVERIECTNCPNLHTLLFSEFSGPCTHWFPNLCDLVIKDCPNLPLPALPHTSTLESINLGYYRPSLTYHGGGLLINGFTCWLALYNLNKLRGVIIRNLSNFSMVDYFQMQRYTDLKSVTIDNCGNMFSGWPVGDENTKPFPPSLRALEICQEPSLQSMGVLSNLTSLTHLKVTDCVNLTMDGFNPLITVSLKELCLYNSSKGEKLAMGMGCSIAADLFSELARTKLPLPSGSFQLEWLVVDSISAVLAAPICSRLSATLRRLDFRFDQQAEGFTEEQEQALQLLTSLHELDFLNCRSLQFLPEGLHHLCSLERLSFRGSPKIQSLPKDGLPNSLRYIHPDSADFRKQLKKLKGAYPNLDV